MDERLLLVEDDPALREAVRLLFERSGYRVAAASDGREAITAFDEGSFDVVVLDIMLPGIDGLEVCREIRRRSGVPIVMLTARAEATDVVVGLELGADDYVTKPFEPAVLLARMRAILRRADEGTSKTVLRVGDLEIDTDSHRVHKEGEPVELTSTEFRLLLELVRRPGHVNTREVLLQRVWGYDYLGDSRLVDMAVKRLRDKLGDDPRSPRYIATVRGIGYRFEVSP